MAVVNHADLLRLACQAAQRSPDPSTQNGALLVGLDGQPILDTLACNEFPAGVGYTAERWERPAKYAYIEHAERNAIYRAAKRGIATEGLTLVAVWAACADCARGIVQAGIRHLVTLDSGIPSERWDSSISVAMDILDEAGVTVTAVPGPLGHVAPLRRNREVFQP